MWVFRSDNPITQLWKNKDAWCREFFPDYARVFDDGYPQPLKIIYGGGRIKRSVTPPEMRPWEFPGQMFRPNGKKLKLDGGVNPNGTPSGRWVDATDDEFREWCANICYFRNGGLAPTGGPGLDPVLLFGGVDHRDRDWYARRQKNGALKKSNKILRRNGDPLIPILAAGYLSCRTGNYYYDQGATYSNPWGVNAVFIHHGAREPLYIQQLWGPDHRPDVAYMGASRRINYVYWDESRDGPRPSQEEYDRERWMPRIQI